MSKKESLSCHYLHHAVYFAPEELRHCCKRFFVNGKIKGDVSILPVTNTEDVTCENIRQAKKSLYEAINQGEETDCTGCPWLERRQWPSLDSLKIDFLSIESQTHCNMRCSYCSEEYYGGLVANYDLDTAIAKLDEGQVLADNLGISWGGGEPTLQKDFDDILTKYTKKLRPYRNKVFSNAINYSQGIADCLKDGTVSLITSIDAGTDETFRKVRGVKQIKSVLANLQKYFQYAGGNITIKYIITEENFSEKEIHAFVKEIEGHGLEHCQFQISSNFKDEEITIVTVNKIYLMKRALGGIGAKFVFIDDHLRPRVDRVMRDLLHSDQPPGEPLATTLRDMERYAETQVIVWGAGDYAHRLINESPFFQFAQVGLVVDTDQNKHGQKIFGHIVEAPLSITSRNEPVVIAASAYYGEILEQLEAMGVDDSRIIDSNLY